MRRVRAKLMAMNMNYQNSDDEDDKKKEVQNKPSNSDITAMKASAAASDALTTLKRSKWEKAVLPPTTQPKI